MHGCVRLCMFLRTYVCTHCMYAWAYVRILRARRYTRSLAIAAELKAIKTELKVSQAMVRPQRPKANAKANAPSITPQSQRPRPQPAPVLALCSPADITATSRRYNAHLTAI